MNKSRFYYKKCCKSIGEKKKSQFVTWKTKSWNITETSAEVTQMKLASTVTYMQNKEIVQWIDNEPLYNG